MRAVILAGGKGRRLLPYTAVFPKPLVPVGDRPILAIVIEQLRRAGFTRLTLAVGHLAGLIQAYFGDGSRFGIPIDYSIETTPMGTAGPLGLLGDLDDDFLVMNGDLLTDLDAFYDGMRRLMYRGHEIVVFHVLDPDELELPFNDLVMFRDIEGNEELLAEPWAFRKSYQQAMQTFLSEVRSGCGDRGIDYVFLRTDEPLAEVLTHYLHSRERRKHLTPRGR